MAYKNALLQGADMIEVDASMTVDGVFYAFHNGEEMLEFGIDRDIRQMKSEEVRKLSALNSLRHTSRQKLERLEEVLEQFRGKCLINIDRSWFYWAEVIGLLKRMGMQDQILLKSGVEERLLKELEEDVYKRQDMAWLPWFSERILLPLPDMAGMQNQIYQNILPELYDDYCYMKGTAYGVPLDPSVQLLFYRKDLFEDVRIKRGYYEKYRRELKVPENFRELNQIAEYFTAKYNTESQTEYGMTCLLYTSRCV